MITFRHFSMASALALSMAVPAAFADEGFIALSAGVADSLDMDSSGYAVKVLFGPRITERLSLEFGLMDMGRTSNNNPKVDFSPTLTDDNPAEFNGESPVFINAKRGRVSSTKGQLNAAGNEPSTAVYTGVSDLRAQSALIGLSYRFPLRSDLDFFVKSGFNIWFADYDVVEITASSDGENNTQVRTTTSDSTSSVYFLTGGGFLWHPLANVSVRAEFETTVLDSLELNSTRFQLMTLGVQYGF